MPGPYPNSVKTSALKSKILHVAQTSVYQVKVQPPISVLTFLNARNFNYYADGENVELMCQIDTIASKVLLILGRFSPERKAILDALRD